MSPKLVKIEAEWYEYVTHGLHIQAKVYDLPSKFGINDGRISKFWVKRNGKEVINYDRGWDIKPKNKEDIEVLNDVLEQFKTKGETK